MTVAAIGDLERVRTLTPGPELAALLAGIDDRFLDHRGQLEVIDGWSRLRAWAEARELRATAVPRPIRHVDGSHRTRTRRPTTRR